MVLRLSRLLMGKWKGWDHIKGRTKAQGSLHIRHTLGSRGRYKKWSDHYGMRDGQRSTMNHIKRGLGVKIGGGLFGLRIPRQKALKSMTKEDLELEVNGHPNITNPYRFYLDEHPALAELTQLPLLRMSVVVAMPLMPSSVFPSLTRNPLRDDARLPPSWVRVKDQLELVLPQLEHTCSCDKLSVTLATHRCALGLNAGETLTEVMTALLKQHSRGIPLRHAAQEQRLNIHRPSALFASGFSNSSASLNVPIAGAGITGNGLHATLEAARRAYPSSLRLRAVLCADKESSSDVVSGRGRCGEEARAEAMLKWWVFNHDTRGHFKDSAGHGRRVVDVTLLVETTTMNRSGESTTAITGTENSASSFQVPEARSIFNAGTKKLLEEHQYKCVAEPLEEIAAALAHFWKPRQQLQTDAAARN